MKYLIPLIALVLVVVATKTVAAYNNAVSVNQAASECIGSYINSGIPRKDIVVNGSTCWVRK